MESMRGDQGSERQSGRRAPPACPRRRAPGRRAPAGVPPDGVPRPACPGRRALAGWRQGGGQTGATAGPVQ